MAVNAEYWIDKLELIKHPEGGYYRETYRSEQLISPPSLDSIYSGNRNSCTAIYYLLSGQDFSAFHRLRSDEIFHFYSGSPLLVYLINEQGDFFTKKLGTQGEERDNFQLVIPHGCWFASEVSVSNSYSLIGCTVSPGFDFNDFELGTRDQLMKIYPHCQDIITKMTYN